MLYMKLNCKQVWKFIIIIINQILNFLKLITINKVTAKYKLKNILQALVEFNSSKFFAINPDT